MSVELGKQKVINYTEHSVEMGSGKLTERRKVQCMWQGTV